ncbi:MAG: PIN domain-containing protein [Roseiarcus sp.]
MFCLDADVVVYALNRRKPRIADRLSAELKAGAALIVPAIVLFELDAAIAKGERREERRAMLEEFLSAGIATPAFDADDAREAGDIAAFLEQLGEPIGPFATLVAAQARRRGATLVTTKTREFERVPGLVVENWAV